MIEAMLTMAIIIAVTIAVDDDMLYFARTVQGEFVTMIRPCVARQCWPYRYATSRLGILHTNRLR